MAASSRQRRREGGRDSGSDVEAAEDGALLVRAGSPLAGGSGLSSSSSSPSSSPHATAVFLEKSCVGGGRHVLFGLAGVLLAAWAAEAALAASAGGGWSQGGGSGGANAHGRRQCPGRSMPDCGGVNHTVMVGGTLAVCLYLWKRKGSHLAEHVFRCLGWLICGVLIVRYINGVTAGDTEPVLKGAFVIVGPSAASSEVQWRRLSGLLASFPPGSVHKAVSPAGAGSEGGGSHGFKSATKLAITMAHASVLADISKREDVSLRDLHGKTKEWFLVLEEDATLLAAFARPSPFAVSANGQEEALHGSLTALLAHLPKRAQAFNLGACKSRIRLPFNAAEDSSEGSSEGTKAGGGRLSCGLFGCDSATFLSSSLSRPLAVTLAALTRGNDGGGNKNGGSSNGGGGDDGGDGAVVDVFRGFGSCRHAYAVTPAGARWMAEVLLSGLLKEDANAHSNELQPSSSSSSSFSGPPPRAAVESGDVAVGRAAFWSQLKHQTFFARVFGQTEWPACD